MIQVYEIRFSAAHFYKNSQWPEDRNLKEFGLCYSKDGFGHGHDYRAEVFLTPEMPGNKVHFELQKIQHYFDHKHLNYDISDFKELIPTTENLALLIQGMLQNAFASHYQKLRLYENENIWTEVMP